MGLCDVCELDYKLEYCCGSHPNTGESVALTVEGSEVRACPNLDENARCKIFDHRPDECYFKCPKYLSE